MDHRFRLIIISLLIGALLSEIALACDAPVWYSSDSNPGGENYADTPEALCDVIKDALVEAYTGYTYYSHGISGVDGSRTCSVTLYQSSPSNPTTLHYTVWEYCPNCETGTHWDNDHGRCMADLEDCPITGQKRKIFLAEPDFTTTFCDGQCVWHKTGNEPIGVGIGDGPIHRSYFYEAREFCEADESNAPPGYPGTQFNEDGTPPDDRHCAIAFGIKVCDKPSNSNGEGGSSCGEVNGQAICPDKMPEGGCVSAADTVACTPSAGSPPAPDNGTPGQPANPDGRMQGQDENGNPTPPINVYAGGTVSGSTEGAQTTDSSEATPPSDDNSDGNCEGPDCDDDDSSYSGGTSCDAAPVCAGDPIGCGIAHNQWLARCSAEEAMQSPDENDLLASTGLDGYTSIDVLPNEEISVLDIFDDSGFLGSRSCPADIQINYFFGDVTFPISQLCALFQLLGTLILMSAYLIAARIVAGGF